MHWESEAIDTGDPTRPFLSRITFGTRKQRETIAEFPSPDLAMAQQRADDWMHEYVARIGAADPKHLQPAVMRARLDRLTDDMPKLPEPGEVYLQALHRTAFESTMQGNGLHGSAAPTRRTTARSPRALLVQTVRAARAAGIDVAGVRVWPDGSVAAFDRRLDIVSSGDHGFVALDDD